MQGESVVIVGTGDFARTAATYLREDSPHSVVAFACLGRMNGSERMLGLPVVPFDEMEDLYPPERFAAFVALGYQRCNRERAQTYDLCKARGYRMISYINSRAIRHPDLVIGDNCFIFENVVIHPFVRIGCDVFLWPCTYIGSNGVVGDHCFISAFSVIPMNVSIGPYCFLGANCTIRDGINVAPECVVGAGAVILRNTKPGGVYAQKSTGPIPISTADLSGFR
jgi:sugar O-acyltransferase (sialic acid O-acetyltransferase NeuD family)